MSIYFGANANNRQLDRMQQLAMMLAVTFTKRLLRSCCKFKFSSAGSFLKTEVTPLASHGCADYVARIISNHIGIIESKQIRSEKLPYDVSSSLQHMQGTNSSSRNEHIIMTMVWNPSRTSQAFNQLHAKVQLSWLVGQVYYLSTDLLLTQCHITTGARWDGPLSTPNMQVRRVSIRFKTSQN